MTRYAEVYKSWQDDPESFWMKQAEAIDWIKLPSKALDDSNPPFYRWFPDGECNTCWNAVDRHVEGGRGDQTAIIYDSPVTNTKRSISYRELKELTAKLAGALKARGINKGDRVIIYMPMIPETVVAMLACARIGAIHSVVFGGFAANELAVRIDDAKPKALIAASCGIEPGRVVAYKPMLDGAIDLAEHKPDFTIMFQRDQSPADLVEGRDIEWHEAQHDVQPTDCVAVGGADPLYILYTSGTTGQPKGVVRPNAGHMVALHWTMENIYDVEPGDVYWAASDVGWVVGHSYIVYAPLLYGCTTVVFEGKPVGTPDAGTFWRVISEHNVKVLFTAPTAFRAIKR
ncbi:MAG: AMP-binding protein, partial [Pseudomonadota bacterium]